MTLGDSKTASNVWETSLLTALRTRGDSRQNLTDLGTSGATVGSYASTIVARLAALPADLPVPTALLNLGSNDLAAGTAESAYKTSLGAIMDAVVARYPAARVHVTLPWRRGYNAAADSMATWIADVVAARPAFSEVADDERSWMKGADDGATMTSDGVHYSTAGHAEKTSQMLTEMGY